MCLVYEYQRKIEGELVGEIRKRFGIIEENWSSKMAQYTETHQKMRLTDDHLYLNHFEVFSS